MASGLREMLAVARTVRRDLGTGRAVAVLAHKWWRKLRRQKPPNTLEANLEVWETHDWSEAGDEWTPSPEWKQAVLYEFLYEYMPRQGALLEIGPGGGRWTEHLAPLARALTLVDLTPACIGLCRARFADHKHIEYHVNDGRSLPFVPDASIDGIWSFDTFVHIAPPDIHSYVKEFARILKPHGVAVIHHARAGAYSRSWRSDMTAEHMQEFCRDFRLQVALQQDSLAGGTIPLYQMATQTKPDVVTVIRKA